MRLFWGLLLGATLSAQANRLVARQAVSTSSQAPLTTSTPSTGNANQSSTSSTIGPITTASSGANGGASAGASGGQGDTTVQVTRTITQGGGGSTVTSTTTVSISTVVTVSVTTTDIATTTVTSSDKETATKVVYVTSTMIVNAKRAVEDDVYLGDAPARVEARATPAAEPVKAVAPQPGGSWFQHVRNKQKRAIVTNIVTFVVSVGGGDSTVVVTATMAVKSTTTTLIHTTSYVTETVQLNAKTTITTTSTIVLKLTQVSTGVIETSTSVPSGSAGSGNNNNNNNDSGLSSGAKAGIGAGVAIAGLLAIGAIILYCMRRRRTPQPDPDDLLGPSSEVPVGAGAGGSRSSRPMSEGLTSTPGAVPSRSPVLPNVQPEGYRGTAMGDGRAGYAKPETYGAAFVPSRSTTTNTRNGNLSPGDQLPRHPTPDTNTASVSPITPIPDTVELGNEGAGVKWHQPGAAEMATDNPAAARWHSDDAHEIDSRPVMSHQSGPVYEMPTESYR